MEQPQDKITKIVDMDGNIDNSIYIIISYDKIIDDENTVHWIANKRKCLAVGYDAQIQDKKDALQVEIDKLNDDTEIQKQIAEKQAELDKLSQTSA